MANCFHCGLQFSEADTIIYEAKVFCCRGCKTVYEIFSNNGLLSYYEYEKTPGATPLEASGKYDFLSNEKIAENLLEFHEGPTAVVPLHIPHIHCSACIWILENLNRLEKEVIKSQVNFHEKKIRITFNPEAISLKELVGLLCKIGYEPNINLDSYGAAKTKDDRSLTYKLGVAFFCFGNIMLLSFPEYFEVREFWLDQYRGFFRWLIFALSLPSFLYSASGYYIAAYNSLRAKRLNMEIPIALGIVIMFIRSISDIISGHGPGFFDSMTGLIFFMLLGKMFQIKTYSFLSFERDYKSYFPIAVTKLAEDGTEESIPVYEIAKGDRLLIRNLEIIPADAILISSAAGIDYSFVTGEAIPVTKTSGDKIFAGGKLLGNVIEVEVIKPVSQSYLTQLWGNDIFQKPFGKSQRTITDSISRYFTPALLTIACIGFGYWIFIDTDKAFNVFTAVLIVACPCALALTAPFTLGNILRIMGRKKIYLKNAQIIEKMAQIDTIVFDKTGTITTNEISNISYQGASLSDLQKCQLKNLLRGSNHPLSRMLYVSLPKCPQLEILSFQELPGLGIEATIGDNHFRIGAPAFAFSGKTHTKAETAVYLSINEVYLGKYVFANNYRTGLSRLFFDLNSCYNLKVLSGDNEGERVHLENILPSSTQLIFNQKPQHKLDFIKTLQQQGKKVMMVGDGLNDAGALAQADVGISISENINVFSPACDAILDAGEFSSLYDFLHLSKKAILVIKMSFVLSLLYNVVGLSFALTGNLLPLVAAIIMPLSTVTIISFVTLASNYFAARLKP